MGKNAGATYGIRKEIDVDALHPDEKAGALSDIMQLRGAIDKIRGHGAALHGMRSCSNELMQLREIEDELNGLIAAAEKAFAKVEALRKYETQCVG